LFRYIAELTPFFKLAVPGVAGCEPLVEGFGGGAAVGSVATGVVEEDEAVG
jgi:hypothetical protein